MSSDDLLFEVLGAAPDFHLDVSFWRDVDASGISFADSFCVGEVLQSLALWEPPMYLWSQCRSLVPTESMIDSFAVSRLVIACGAPSDVLCLASSAVEKLDSVALERKRLID